MFQKVLANKHRSVRDLNQKLAERRSASGHRQNEKKQERSQILTALLKFTLFSLSTTVETH